MWSLTYNLQDMTHLHYTRVLWKGERTRQRLLFVWQHAEHPHRERFHENRALITGFLESADPQQYVDALPGGVWSLRTLTREIPSVPGDLWEDSAPGKGRLGHRPANS